MPTARDRYYSSPPEMHALGFNYAWSPTSIQTGVSNPNTGLWVPMQVDASGRMQVAIDNVTFSGEVKTDNAQLEALVLTGIQYESGISGQLGSVIKTSQANGYSTNTGILIEGVARVVSGFSPQYASGANAAVSIDNINGGILMVQSDLSKDTDQVVAYPPQFSTVSNNTVSGSSTSITTGVALQSNVLRNEFYIQVVGSGGPLWVLFGDGAAGTGRANVVLKPASADMFYDGGVLSNTTYQGAVSVSGHLGCKFLIWQA